MPIIGETVLNDTNEKDERKVTFGKMEKDDNVGEEKIPRIYVDVVRSDIKLKVWGWHQVAIIFI